MINRAMQKRYAKIAPTWNGTGYAGLRRDDLIPDIIKAANIPGTGCLNVLEAMCGTGLIGSALKKRLRKKINMFFLDASWAMLGQIKIPAPKAIGDVCAMPYPKNTFDRVIIRFGIHDLQKCDQPTAFKEIRRVLKKNGLFVLIAYHTTPATSRYYHEIIQCKDALAGFPTDSRYFPTFEEYLELFKNSCFSDIKNELEFKGKIRYQRTGELQDETAQIWKEKILSLPAEINSFMSLKLESDQTITYEVPAAIFTAKK